MMEYIKMEVAGNLETPIVDTYHLEGFEFMNNLQIGPNQLIEILTKLTDKAPISIEFGIHPGLVEQHLFNYVLKEFTKNVAKDYTFRSYTAFCKLFFTRESAFSSINAIESMLTDALSFYSVIVRAHNNDIIIPRELITFMVESKNVPRWLLNQSIHLALVKSTNNEPMNISTESSGEEDGSIIHSFLTKMLDIDENSSPTQKEKLLNLKDILGSLGIDSNLN